MVVRALDEKRGLGFTHFYDAQDYG